MVLYVTINYLKMLVITKKDKRSPHDVVLGRTELLGWDDTIMLYSVRGCPGVSGVSGVSGPPSARVTALPTL